MLVMDEKKIISNWIGNLKPILSISCVTYNHEDFIEQCLDSFLSQVTKYPYEILIHDDASTDGTPNIIKLYQKKYPNIIFPIFQKINQYSQAIKPNIFNFKKARGQFIAFCDGDDFWSSNKKIDIQIDHMNLFSECDVSFHGVEVIHLNKQKELLLANTKPYVYSLNQIIAKDHKLVFSSSSIMIRSNIISTIPNFYLIAPVEDYYLRILGAVRGGGLYIPEILSSYRRFTPNSFTLVHQRSPQIALKNYLTMKEVRKYLNKSLFSIVGIKLIQFHLKYLVLKLLYVLKKR